MPGDFAKSFDFTSDEVNECFDGILEGGPRLIPVEIFEQMRACCLANAADSDAQPAQAAQYPPDWPNGPDREPAQAAQWPAELKAIGFEDAASVIGYLDDIDSEVARITGDEGDDSSLTVLRRIPAQAAQPSVIAPSVQTLPLKSVPYEVTTTAQPSVDAEDAARYRWLRPRLLTADFEYGDDSETVLVFLIPTTMAVSANLDKSIDAARAAEGDGNG